MDLGLWLLAIACLGTAAMATLAFGEGRMAARSALVVVWGAMAPLAAIGALLAPFVIAEVIAPPLRPPGAPPSLPWYAWQKLWTLLLPPAWLALLGWLIHARPDSPRDGPWIIPFTGGLAFVLLGIAGGVLSRVE